MEKITKELTPDELKEFEAFKAQKEAKERAEKQKKDREALRELKDEFVKKHFPQLINTAKSLSESKVKILEAAQTILGLKKGVCGLSDEAFAQQQSHSLSTKDNSQTIIIGYNIVDDWDPDLLIIGQDGVNKWLLRKTEENDPNIVGFIKKLLRPNKEGVLQSKRVLEMYTYAIEIGDDELIQHVQNIQAAYRPKKTTVYVKAKYRNDNGQDIWLNLSMSNA